MSKEETKPQPKVVYNCFYCDKGTVESLPSPCPACGSLLTKPVDELTKEEASIAVIRKYGMVAETVQAYTLAE